MLDLNIDRCGAAGASSLLFLREYFIYLILCSLSGPFTNELDTRNFANMRSPGGRPFRSSALALSDEPLHLTYANLGLTVMSTELQSPTARPIATHRACTLHPFTYGILHTRYGGGGRGQPRIGVRTMGMVPLSYPQCLEYRRMGRVVSVNTLYTPDVIFPSHACQLGFQFE